MATDAQRLNVIIAARDREFQRVVGRVNKSLHRLEQRTRGSTRQMSKGFTVARAAFANMIGVMGGASIAGAIAGVSKVVEKLDSIGKTADALGVSTTWLQEMRYAAESAGVSVQEFDKGFKRFNQAVYDASEGLSTYQRHFQSLGVDLFDAQGNIRATTDIFNDFADALHSVGSEAQRQGAVRDLLGGRQGSKFLVFMQGGAAGVDRLVQKVVQAGAVIDDHFIRRAEEVQTEYDLAMRVVTANMTTTSFMIKQVFGETMVALTTAVRVILDSYNEIGKKSSATLREIRADNKRLIEDIKQSGAAVVDPTLYMGSMQGFTTLTTGQQTAKLEAEIKKIDEILKERERIAREFQAARQAEADTAKYMTAIQGLRDEIELLKIKDERLKSIRQFEQRIGKTLTRDEQTEFLELNEQKQTYLELAETKRENEALNIRATAVLDKLKTSQDRHNDEVKEVEELYRRGALTANEYAAAVVAIDRSYQQLTERENQLMTMQQNLESAFESTFSNIHNIVLEGSDGIRSAVRSLVNAVLTEFMRIAVAQPLAQMMAAGLTGFFGGMMGGGSAMSSGVGAAGPAGLATGGSAFAGTPYIVGERGPELFVPSANGRVFSNAETGRMVGGSGGNISITQNLNFSLGVQETVKNEIYGMLPQITEVTKAGVRDAEMRGIM